MAANNMSSDVGSADEDDNVFHSAREKRLKLNQRLMLVYQIVERTLVKGVLMLDILALMKHMNA